MRHNIRFLLIVTMLLLVTGSGTAQKFVHPGIDMNSADLEYMRNQVLAGMGHRTKRILRIERKEYQTY